MLQRRHPSKCTLRAFSLPELLVVLVIIGILVLIALPNLMPLISRAKATAIHANVPTRKSPKLTLITQLHLTYL